MKRILLIVSVAVIMTAASAVPAMADTYYYCEWDELGNYACLFW